MFARTSLTIVLGSLLFLALPASSQTTTLTGIQNISIYRFTLKSVTLNGGSCVPSCAATLLPGAVQFYRFAATNPIIFNYDVLDNTTKIGSFTLNADLKQVAVTNGLGTSITQGTTAYQVNYQPPKPIWQGIFTDTKNLLNNNFLITKSLPSWGLSNITIKSATSTDASPNKQNYMRVKYPAGSANSGSSPPLPLGGAQFYAAIINSPTPITLSYYLRFPTNFPFANKPGSARPYTLGKLPGLYSGRGNTGSNLPNGYDGWSVRLMWCSYAQETKRKIKAGGEIVQMTPDANQGLYASAKGKFIGCGSWYFSPDAKWHNVQETIRLNDPGKSNGRIDICYDGKLVYSVPNVNFRKTTALNINGILFQTFFGGDGKEYATPITTYADFAEFKLFNYPSSAPAGLCIGNP